MITNERLATLLRELIEACENGKRVDIVCDEARALLSATDALVAANTAILETAATTAAAAAADRVAHWRALYWEISDRWDKAEDELENRVTIAESSLAAEREARREWQRLHGALADRYDLAESRLAEATKLVSDYFAAHPFGRLGDAARAFLGE